MAARKTGAARNPTIGWRLAAGRPRLFVLAVIDIRKLKPPCFCTSVSEDYLDGLASWKKLKDPIAKVTKPAIVQTNAELAVIVPPTMQMPQAASPREIRYATAVSVSQSMNRELLI
jgi:hypothetical protein